jgi:hypothetical protein
MPKKHIYRISLFIFVGFFAVLPFLFCQVLSEEEKTIYDQAIEHFEKKEYKESLFFINRLLNIYPKDPFFNYYSGVSLTELENNLETAIYQLRLASLKDVPKNVYYYLGKAHHLREEFNEAIKYYERFISFGDRVEVKDLQTERLLEMCRRKTDQADKVGVKPLKAQETQVKLDDSVKEADLKDQQSAGSEKPARTEDKLIDYNSLLDLALNYQVKADSTRRLADEKRELLEKISNSETRSRTEKSILEFEKQAFEFQKLADENYELIREIEQDRLSNKITAGKNESPDKKPEDKESIPGSAGSSDDYNGTTILRQIIDDFYLTEEFQGVFKKNELNVLNDLAVINKEANRAMNDASEMQKTLENETVVANAAQSKREHRRALGKIADLERKIVKRKTYAISCYQEINDTRYRVFNNKLNNFKEHEDNTDIESQALLYQKNAETSYLKALTLRSDGNKILKADQKYDKLVKANAYELLALENQKSALATYTGILPVQKPKLETGEPLTGISSQQSKKDTITTEIKPERDIRKTEADITENLQTELADVSEAKAKTVQERSGSAQVDREESLETEGFNYEFTILETTPYSTSNPIPLDAFLPDRVVYRIQVGVFRNPIPPGYFKGLTPVMAEIIPESGLKRYYTGTFEKYVDARAALSKVQNLGFQDAFIVAHFMRKKISLNRARNLENIYDSENQD